jgi:cation diffusion facilitator CzcD-associated flavoprotein CzcO
MLRDISEGKKVQVVNGPISEEEVDVLVIGAGFAGVYLLYQLRKRGFNIKGVEAGSDLGGVWHWNRYPGARVDSQYPIYCYSLPEIWEGWTWTNDYPEWHELQRYFAHVEEKLQIKKDIVFNTKIVAATFNEITNTWTVECDTGKRYRAHFLLASTGFAAKRYIPDYPGLETFQGIMHHSSFWPEEHVDVKGLRVGVLGCGSSGIQITQEWAKEVGDTGNFILLQRTPNLCLPISVAN